MLTNADLMAATNIPTAHSYRHICPGTVFDGSASRTADELMHSVVTLAISCGMAPADFPPDLLDDTALEMLALKLEWWDYSGHSGTLWLSDTALQQGLHMTLLDLYNAAENWFNTAPDPNGVDVVRCHPDYARTHHYELDDGFILVPNDPSGL